MESVDIRLEITKGVMQRKNQVSVKVKQFTVRKWLITRINSAYQPAFINYRVEEIDRDRCFVMERKR